MLLESDRCPVPVTADCRAIKDLYRCFHDLFYCQRGAVPAMAVLNFSAIAVRMSP